MRRQAGQSLAEALALLLVLLPLWWMTQALAFALDEQAALREQTRLAAFEARLLLPAGVPAARRQALTVDRALRSPSGTPIELSAAAGPIPGEPGRAVPVVFASLGPVTALARVPTDLMPEGWQRIAGQLPLRWPASMASRGGLPEHLQLRHELALLADDWSARDARHVHARTDAFVPSLPLRALAAPLTVGVIRPALELLEPAMSQLCVGWIDPDVLPPDRLATLTPSTRAGARQQNWRPPC